MEIFVFACIHLTHMSPMKNVEFLYRGSFLSEIMEAHVSPDVLGDIIRSIGIDRRSIKDYMKDDQYLAADLTHVLSMREGVISGTFDHNSMAEFLL